MVFPVPGWPSTIMLSMAGTVTRSYWSGWSVARTGARLLVRGACNCVRSNSSARTGRADSIFRPAGLSGAGAGCRLVSSTRWVEPSDRAATGVSALDTGTGAGLPMGFGRGRLPDLLGGVGQGWGQSRGFGACWLCHGLVSFRVTGGVYSPRRVRARKPVRSQPSSRRAAAWLAWPARLRTLVTALPMEANRRGDCPARSREASSPRVTSRR